MKKQKSKPDSIEITSDVTLKKCPCCKGFAQVFYMPLVIGRYSITCGSCGLSTRWCQTISEAKMLWNYRGD